MRLKENARKRKKLLKIKKQKWKQFIYHNKRKLKRYKKFKPNNQTQYIVSKFPNRANLYKKRLKNALDTLKKFISRFFLQPLLTCFVIIICVISWLNNFFLILIHFCVLVV